MPRVNLSISQEIYDKLQADAESRGLTVNHMVYSLLEEKYGERGFDYVMALDCLKQEAESMQGDFILSDLPTFKGLDEVLVEMQAKESPAQVKARLGKMFNEAVKQGAIKDINRSVVIEQDGTQKARTLSRAAVYAKKLADLKKEG
ncbi:hypothetical protein SAMN02910298_02219 [Pseudobutyrivibrio sp. YE44]|uniref:hypothetical protein n=1 Tax=Pseudobutyrivibrio sp. YE44 TaxID=1520802 RepID=UPI00088C0820|nr:hypothetical protein [Pseudobutyrivibrio sp. YE44]SDB44736.1 hypothetical protein SAMN02910298_02219 [Pseudobutyrivibrio sp. YE44]